MNPMLAVSNLFVRRGTQTILNRINWRVDPGENWVILGANGSGKTSLLSALTGYLTPTDGEIGVLGETFGQTDWRDLRRLIGLVSSSIRQRIPDNEPALQTVVSGKYAMIDFWGRMTPGDALEARRVLRKVDAGSLETRPWLYLSQGERQRVLIGRALMAKPKLLILDEPCSGLDPAAREHFLNFIQRFQTKPKAPAIVLVTHHVEEIRPIFTHVLLLSKGRVTAQGPMKTVLTSANLSRAFDCPISLKRQRQQYRIEFA